MTERPPGLEQTPDEALVARARRGDRAAFGELVRRFQRPLMAKALRMTRNIENADDLVQETFLRAFTRLETVRDETRFGGWLFRILENLATDRLRYDARRPVVDGDLDETTASSLPGPEEHLLAREVRRAIRRRLAELPAGRRREVFRLRFVEGLPLAEIARRLGVHTGTVKVHLFRLTKDLRRQVRELEIPR